jgi:hypothetical protein
MQSNESSSSSTSPSHQGETDVVKNSNNKRAREQEESIENQQQHDEEIARKRRKIEHEQQQSSSSSIENNEQQQDTTMTDNNTLVQQSIKTFKGIPNAVTESLVEIYAESNSSDDIQQYISNIKVINMSENGQLVAQLDIYDKLHTVTIKFSGNYVSEIACQVPECSNSCAFWCDHATSVLLMCIRSPGSVLNKQSMEEFLVAANNENLLVPAVLKYFQNHPVDYVELVQNINELRSNKLSINVSSDVPEVTTIPVSTGIVNDNTDTSTSTAPSHYINFELIKWKLDDAIATFVIGYTNTSRCEGCDCDCHGSNKKDFYGRKRSHWNYSPSSSDSDSDDECDSCDEGTSHHDFPVDLVVGYVDKAGPIFNMASLCDAKNSLKILEIVGTSLLSIDLSIFENEACLSAAKNINSIIDDMRDTLIQIALENGKQQLEEADRKHMVEVLTNWDTVLEELHNTVLNEAPFDLRATIDAMKNGWNGEQLLKVLSGNPEAMEAFDEVEDISSIRLFELVSESRILEAGYYCEAVGNNLVACICYLIVDKFDRAIELTKKQMVLCVSCFTACIAYINMKNSNVSQTTIEDNMTTLFDEFNSCISNRGNIESVVDTCSEYLTSLSNVSDPQLQQYSNILFDAIVFVLNNHKPANKIQIAIASNISESIKEKTNRIETTSHSMMLLLLFFGFDIRMEEVQKMILENLENYSRDLDYYVSRMFFEIFKNPLFSYTIAQHSLRLNDIPRQDFCLWLSKVVHQMETQSTDPADSPTKFFSDQLKTRFSSSLTNIDILVQCAANLNDVNEQFDIMMHALRASVQIAIQKVVVIPSNIFIQTTQIACIPDTTRTTTYPEKLRTERLDAMIQVIQELLRLDNPITQSYAKQYKYTVAVGKVLEETVQQMVSMGYLMSEMELLKFSIKFLTAIVTTTSSKQVQQNWDNFINKIRRRFTCTCATCKSAYQWIKNPNTTGTSGVYKCTTSRLRTINGGNCFTVNSLENGLVRITKTDRLLRVQELSPEYYEKLVMILSNQKQRLLDVAYHLDHVIRTETDDFNPPYFNKVVESMYSNNLLKTRQDKINSYLKYHMYENVIELASDLPEMTPHNQSTIQLIMEAIIEAAKSLSKMTNNQSDERKQKCIQLAQDLFKMNPTIANFNRLEDLAILLYGQNQWISMFPVPLLQWLLETYKLNEMTIGNTLPEIYEVTIELLIRFSYLQRVAEILIAQIGKNKDKEGICCTLFEHVFKLLAKYRVSEGSIHSNFKKVFLSYGALMINTKWKIETEGSTVQNTMTNAERQVFESIDKFWKHSHSSLQFENDIVFRFTLPLCSDFYLWFQKQKIVKLQQLVFTNGVYSNIVTLLIKINKSMEVFGNAESGWTKYIEDFKRVNKGKKSLIRMIDSNINLQPEYSKKNKQNFARDIRNVFYTTGTRDLQVLSSTAVASPTCESDGISDEELMCMGNRNVDIYDPIAKTVMENPVKSTTCGHTFEKMHILELIKRQNGCCDCPIAGCNKQIRGTDLTADIEMKRMIQEEIQRQQQQQEQNTVEVIALDDD